MKNVNKVILNSIALIMLIFCGTIIWFYLEMWVPHRTIYNSRHFDLEQDYRARKKVRDASHKVLFLWIGNYHDALMTIFDVGDKDSIPYLIRALKRFNLKAQSQKAKPMDNFYIDYGHCVKCCRGTLKKFTGLDFGTDHTKWQDWWEQTGCHLTFDENKGQLVSQEETK